MMDPLTALGVAANVIQFVDFSIKLCAKAHEIRKSGNVQDHVDAERAAITIRFLQSKLIIPHGGNTIVTETQGLLEGLCSSCTETATQILDVLEELKVRGKMTTWKSMREAIKSIMGKAAIVELSSRLEEFRKLIEVTVLVDLRYVQSGPTIIPYSLSAVPRLISSS